MPPRKSYPDEVHQLLANKVRALRLARGWSQEQLSDVSGLHRNYIGYIERAECNVGLINLKRLARAFDVPVHEMLMADDRVDEIAAATYRCDAPSYH